MKQASLSQAREPKPETEVWSIGALAVLIAGSVLIVGFFVDREGRVDELGLYNPIYTYLHHGKMTYPVHYQFDSMTIHPPVHYLEIARLMEIGLSLYQAEAVPKLIMTLVILFLIYHGRFPSGVKLGLMFGFLSASVFLSPEWAGFMYSIRPDLHLALAWFAGLIALEVARLDNWNGVKLFLGSFLLTYASGLHYFGAIAFTGVFVYVLWAYRELGLARAKTKILALVAGGCLFGLPYLIFFVVPYWDGIWDIVTEVQGDGGLAEAVARHIASYDNWAQRLAEELPARLVTTIFTWPIMRLRLPAVFVSTLLLLIWPGTRGIALASMPLPLSVLLYSQAKSAGYYVPEFMLYLSGVAILTIMSFVWLSRRVMHSNHHWLTTPIAAAVVGIGVLSSNPLLSEAELSLKPRVHEMRIARAVGREIVGRSALVGGRIGLWYAAGATHWYDVAADLLWREVLEVDVSAYFSNFDAIAEYDHMSDVTLNLRHMSLPSWYADGTLDLLGFYFSESHSNLSFLLLNVQPAAEVVGYGLKDGQLFRFQEHPGGDYIFAAMLCPINARLSEDRSDLTFFNTLLLPKANKGDQQMAVTTLVMARDKYKVARFAAASACQRRDEIAGYLRPVDVDVLLAKLITEDQTVRFYPTLMDAVLAKNVTAGPD